MWDLAVREEDYRAAEAMLHRYTGQAPLSMRALLAYGRHDSTALGPVLGELEGADNRQPQIAGRFIATYLEDFGTAERVARLSLAPERRPALQVGAHELLAWLEIARGRWSGAKTAFAAAEAVPGGAAPQTVARALAATLPFLEIPVADLTAVRREVEQWRPESEASMPRATLAAVLRPHLRVYLLGLLSARLADDAAASRFATELERGQAPAHSGALVQDLARVVRAEVALRHERADEAVRTLASVGAEVPLELVSVPMYATVRAFTGEHARFLRARALVALGRDGEALRWLATGFQGAPNEMAYLAPMHFLYGLAYARMGNRSQAVQHYNRFMALWAECDPALKPRVEEARRLLAQLGSRRQ